MIGRCRPSSDKRKRYYDRGIKVCERWRYSYKAFVADVGFAPSDARTLERIRNGEGYKPGNVRWASRREQAQNRENTLKLTHKGKTKPVIEWARQFKLKYTTLRMRLRRGWTPAQALGIKPNVGGYYSSRPRRYRSRKKNE